MITTMQMGLGSHGPWSSAVPLGSAQRVMKVTGLLIVALIGSTAPLVVRAASPAASPNTACLALQAADFSSLMDAPTRLTGTRVVAGSSDSPSYCEVDAYVAPQVGLEVRLPLSNWNVKLMAVGIGGWAGAIISGACDASLRRGYACVATD